MEKLEESFSGVVDLDKVPGAIFVVDIKREEIAIREANRLNIPIVAICDTNVDPELVSYPIPGNDDAIRSIKLIVGLIGQSISNGWSRYQATNQPVTPLAAANGDAAAADEAEAMKPAATDAKDA
jgi:small subunit ribosomal protein S2